MESPFVPFLPLSFSVLETSKIKRFNESLVSYLLKQNENRNNITTSLIHTLESRLLIFRFFSTQDIFIPTLVLTLASDIVVLYGNDPFSILVLSSKKRYSSFLKKVFLFQKSCFKVKVLKTIKISTDCHIKTYRPLKRRTILKIPSTVLQKNLCSSVGFKMKSLRKSVFHC